MRELTKKEIDNAPYWATHYVVPKADYDIIYESIHFYWWSGMIEKVGNVRVSLDAKTIIRNPFSIDDYEFSNPDIEIYEYCDDVVSLSINFGEANCLMSLNKSDSIALAKHFKLTADDLIPR